MDQGENSEMSFAGKPQHSTERVQSSDKCYNVAELRSEILGMLEFGKKCLEGSHPPEVYLRSRTADGIEGRTDSLRTDSFENTQNSAALIGPLLEQVNQLTEINNQLTDENIQLKQLVADFRQQQQQQQLEAHGSRCSSVEAAAEEVELLRAQLQVFREDFDSERKDRERVQSRLADCQRELLEVRRQLAQYQRQETQRLTLGDNSPERSSQSMLPSRSRVELRTHAERSVNCTTSLTSRGVYQTDGIACGGTYDETDSPAVAPPRRAFSEKISSGVKTSMIYDDEFLYCPRCKKQFLQEKHAQLLEHMERCSNGGNSSQM